MICQISCAECFSYSRRPFEKYAERPSFYDDFIEQACRQCIGDLTLHGLGNDEGLLVLLCESFQPGGKVHHVADYGIIHLFFRTDIPDGNRAAFGGSS